MSWSKVQVLGFIKEYRSHECLWQVKHKDYCNKLKKEKCYEKLVSFVQSFDPKANRDSILKRIHNMRGSFKKELKKVARSKLPGSDPEDEYSPRLWYFDLLSFLINQELPRASTSTISQLKEKIIDASRATTPESVESTRNNKEDIVFTESIDESQCTDWKPIVSCSQDNEEAFIESPIEEDQSQSEEEASYIKAGPSSVPVYIASCIPKSPKPSGSPASSSVSKKRKTQEKQLLMKACEALNSTSKADRYDIFAQTVSQSLKHMPGDQWLHAQKLISDILYAGELGKLSMKSYFVAEPSSHYGATLHNSS